MNEAIICKYCGHSSASKLEAAHHVCDPNDLKDRIDGLDAHCKMWHGEAVRLATKHNEDTFYHSKTRVVKQVA